MFHNAYAVTGDRRYYEPMRIEYELAARYGRAPVGETGARLQPVPSDDDAPRPPSRAVAEGTAGAPEPGSERWVAHNVKGVSQWLVARRILDGRKGRLQNDLTRKRTSSGRPGGRPRSCASAGR